MKIAPGIYRIKVPIPDNPLGHLNSYLVEGKAGWFMIDTGWFTPGAFDALKAGLGELGIALTDIHTIFVTHVHPDHFGLAGRIRHISPNTRFITHQMEADLIEERYIKFSELQQKMEVLLKCHGVPPSQLSRLGSSSMPAIEYVRITFPDRTVYGGEIIDTGSYKLEVIWTPGHSIGHACLYEPGHKLLFSGDHVLPHITPNVSYHVQSGDNPLGDYLNALHKIENLHATKILPGHEDVFEDLTGRIREIDAHHGERQEEIRQVISEKSRSAYDIASHLTWNIPDSDWDNLPPLHKRVAITETIAHLEYMRWSGKARRGLDGDLFTYRSF